MRFEIAVGGFALSFAAVLAAPIPALADSVPDQIVVTATRLPEDVDTVPADVTVISGDDLRARHVTDLRTALAQVAGIEAPPGGDAGPASAVPSIWGLHEFDAFLLVVDGVPWGGAFNPAIPSLDLNDVERIEVLKGSAPVIFGATSFVGVIQVIHRPAGQAVSTVSVGGGTHGSARGQISVNLPNLGGFTQSLSLDGESLGYNDPRTGVSNGHALYRAAGQVGPGTLTIDADISFVRTLPSSPVIRQGTGLTTLTPLDANYNPANAHINENHYHAVVGYAMPVGAGTWQSTVSLAYSDISDVRGFLRPDLTNNGSQNADSQQQDRHIVDLYADTHYAFQPTAGLDVVTGADLLYGFARQESINGAYYAPLNGSVVPPPTTSLHVDEINSVSDRRVFVGQYVQADWKLGPAVDINAGARLNETDEHLVSRHIDGFDAVNDLAGDSSGSIVRGTAAVGASYAPLPDARRALVLYADFRDSFKPSAIDFGPDYTPNVLAPERALSYEAGVRGRLADGVVRYGMEVFQLDFRNLVVATTAADGEPILENAGGERLRGVEAELEVRPLADLALRLTASDHEARFTQYIATEDGANVNASGKLLPLSPRVLVSGGAVYDPAEGLQASTTATYVGRRYLDIANTAPVGGYATLDASLGWRFGQYEVAVTGTNLSDQRPPVTASEFGDSSFYLLPGREVFVDVTAKF